MAIGTSEALVLSPEHIEQTLLRLVEARGAGRTICPSEVARAIESDEASWRSLLPGVRRAAIALARDGRIVITRKGKVIDPAAVKGVIRLGLPPGSADPSRLRKTDAG